MTFVDRYREAGYEKNPFSTAALSESSIFVDRGLRPPEPGARTMYQLIGDRGFGKSTHLQRWQSTQPGPVHYVPPEPYAKRWATPPTGNATVYGDEIDRMPSLLRWRWFRSLAKAGATVIIGTHVDLRGVAERAGFTVVSHHLVPLTRDEVECVVGQHVERVRIGEPRVHFDSNDLDEIYAKTGGVPRDVEALCHGLLADKVALLDSTPPQDRSAMTT